MWSLKSPDASTLRTLLAEQARFELTYAEVGASATPVPPGYDLDDARVLLGRGTDVFAAAARALRLWRPFLTGWTTAYPADTPLAVGGAVAMTARAFGLWWTNCCRIVYVVDEGPPHARFGFAYGTLPLHVEQGEERFLVERLPDDSVWYSLRAVSRPRYWMVRLGYPLARRLQRRFARDSMAAMRRAVAGEGFSP